MYVNNNVCDVYNSKILKHSKSVQKFALNTR